MGFFHEMLQHKAKTKMTSSNLAIIIAPNILRCKTESVQQIMRDAPHVQSVIRCMIDDFPALFDVRCLLRRPLRPSHNLFICSALSSPHNAGALCTTLQPAKHGQSPH